MGDAGAVSEKAEVQNRRGLLRRVRGMSGGREIGGIQAGRDDERHSNIAS